MGYLHKLAFCFLGVEKLTMTKRVFHFKLDEKIDETIIRILDLEPNFQKYFYELLNSYIKGDLERTQTEENLKKLKLKVDIEFKQVMIEIKKKELLYRNTFGNSPSFSAVRAIHKGEKNKEIPNNVSSFDEKNNRFMCPECGSCFVFGADQKDIAESKENFIDHYFNKHGEIPKSLEHELREMI